MPTGEDIDHYKLLSVHEQPLDNRQKYLDVLCFPTLFPTGMYGAHHPPTPVVCYTWNGPLPALKLTLRCEKCGINYRYEHYGNSKCGYTTTFYALLPTCLY